MVVVRVEAAQAQVRADRDPRLERQHRQLRLSLEGVSEQVEFPDGLQFAVTGNYVGVGPESLRRVWIEGRSLQLAVPGISPHEIWGRG